LKPSFCEKNFIFSETAILGRFRVFLQGESQAGSDAMPGRVGMVETWGGVL
jgi:hypothetical protein